MPPREDMPDVPMGQMLSHMQQFVEQATSNTAMAVAQICNSRVVNPVDPHWHHSQHVHVEGESLLESAEATGNYAGRYHYMSRRMRDDYEMTERVLGDGLNEEVKAAVSKALNDRSFAVKVLSLAGASTQSAKDIRSEVQVLLSLDHPHIVRLIDVYDSGDTIHLVMENLCGGDLEDRAAQTWRFEEQEAADAIGQMLLAVNYLHQQGVVHRNLKASHFMYDSTARNHLKLIGFGCSRFWQEGVDPEMEHMCGTFGYAAPEMLQERYTSQVDLWGMGVIAFLLILGYMPFATKSNKEALSNLLQGSYTKKPERWETVSEDAADFVHSLLHVGPELRSTAAAALEHPWLLGHRRNQSSSRRLQQGSVEALRHFVQTPRLHQCFMEALAWSLSSEEQAKVRGPFLTMDIDRDGVISYNDFKAVMISQERLGRDEVRAMFNVLDFDRDDHVPYSRILASLLSTKISVYNWLLPAVFRRFEVDNSDINTGQVAIHSFLDSFGTKSSGPAAPFSQTFSAERLSESPPAEMMSFSMFATYILVHEALAREQSESPERQRGSQAGGYEEESRWEVQTAHGWKLWAPGVHFCGAIGEEVFFTLGSTSYKAYFESERCGSQTNLNTGVESLLRRGGTPQIGDRTPMGAVGLHVLSAARAGPRPKSKASLTEVLAPLEFTI